MISVYLLLDLYMQITNPLRRRIFIGFNVIFVEENMILPF